MDNKKLMQILLRDVSELQELVNGIKNSGHYEPIDMELVYTRISGVRHMLEVASDSVPSVRKTEIEMVFPGTEIHVEAAAPLKTSTDTGQEERSKPHPRFTQIVEKRPSPKTHIVEPAVTMIEKIPETEQPGVEIPTTSSPTEIEPRLVTIPENDEMELEEEIVVPPQTFGEKFQHSKSVNDLLIEHGKTDYKYSNMPVPNLQAAIGINDRFLFTRELFEGNADRFNETVRNIDSMASIHDAATFLRENFKWKKNETSLKFIDLVKRRFL